MRLITFKMPQNIIIPIVSVSCCTLIGLITIYSWWSDATLKQQPMPKPSIAVNKKNSDFTDLQSAHLFGTAFNADEMPISNLQVHISGIVIGIGDRSQGKAYIASLGSKEKIYLAGDLLAPGTKVYQIVKDGVILENHGKLEKILLNRPNLAFKKTT